MDPIRNPFAPGAGTPPPELAGRAEFLARADNEFPFADLGKETVLRPRQKTLPCRVLQNPLGSRLNWYHQ